MAVPADVVWVDQCELQFLVAHRWAPIQDRPFGLRREIAARVARARPNRCRFGKDARS